MPCARASALTDCVQRVNPHLSGDIVGKSTLFSGFTCDLNDARRTNCPTQAANLQTIPQQVREKGEPNRSFHIRAEESVEWEVGDEDAVREDCHSREHCKYEEAIDELQSRWRCP